MVEDIAPKPLGGAPGQIGAWGSQDAFGGFGDIGSGLPDNSVGQGINTDDVHTWLSQRGRPW